MNAIPFRVAAILATLLVALLAGPTQGQAPEADLDSFLEQVKRLAQEPGGKPPIKQLWDRLVLAGRVPFVTGERVALLYYDESAVAQSVAWHGDFSSWKPVEGNKLGGSNLWVHETTLPPDARSDYKIAVDGRWALDPANQLISWSGFGPNSELRMPGYVFPKITIPREAAPKGTVSQPATLSHEQLPCELQYRVYTPPGYGAQQLSDLPSVYVTDGHEYLDQRLGAMPAVLDNLIHEGKLRPVIVVFIDPRDAATGANRRMELYLLNHGFLDSIADHLIPHIDESHRTDQRAGSRTILGTSLGGLFAGWFASERPDRVRHAVMQSPGLGERLLKAWEEAPPSGVDLYLTGGTLGDNRTPKLLTAWLSERDIPFRYKTVNEGHAWGAWRGQLAELLINTVGPPSHQ